MTIYAPFAKALAEDWADDFPDVVQIQQARDQGSEAAKDGKSKDENPYDEGALKDAWDRGWDQETYAIVAC